MIKNKYNFCLFFFCLPQLFAAESESGSNGCGLWSYWNLRTNWEGIFGVQCIWYRITALVRYVGIPEKTYRSMAHSERSRRGNTTKQVKRLTTIPAKASQKDIRCNIAFSFKLEINWFVCWVVQVKKNIHGE